ncbi:MAG: VanW family protein [Lewinella sp.]|nr:VanW family protein [Lewinella sp.]
MNSRQITPRWLKIGRQLLKRFLKYQVGRPDIRFAVAVPTHPVPFRVSVTQAVRRSYLYENKISNLRLAGVRVGRFVVQPGETFSFWRAVGPPTARRGFLPGRNLIGGELKEDYGGGLCQMSGLLYHLSLMAGLEIVERHNHSTDIYQDHERFTPLGADATVVYGYRDLMVRNTLDDAVYFSVTVEDDQVIGMLHCAGEITVRELEFRLVWEDGQAKEVLTVDGAGEVLCRSVYGGDYPL